VEAVVALAHTLQIAMTAEGIETAAQQEAIAALGCDYGQGYRFAPPLPAERARTIGQE
jgi:EAL domain-containing protein (putative c-di-GMP-specific phosphodiesterase class I)